MSEKVDREECTVGRRAWRGIARGARRRENSRIVPISAGAAEWMMVALTELGWVGKGQKRCQS